jgi:hypothetical protein
MADTDHTLAQDQSQPVPWLSGGPFASDRCDGCSMLLAPDDDWGLCTACLGASGGPNRTKALKARLAQTE